MRTSAPDHAAIARRRQALEDSHPRWVPRSLDQHLDHCAERWPDRPFVIWQDEASTYADLARSSRRFATALCAAGVEPGDHIGLLMGNSAEFLALTFAAGRVGATVVPLNYLLAARELSHVLRHARITTVIVDRTAAGVDLVALLNAVLKPAAGAPVADAYPDLRAVLLREPWAGVDTQPAFECTLLGLGAEFAEAGRSGPDSVSHIFYTSGSTAFPKGVLIRHDAVLREAYGTAYSRAYEDGWRMITALPSFHIFGVMQCVIGPSMVGGSVVLEPSFDARRYLEQIERHQVRDMIAVPAMTQRIVGLAAEDGIRLSSLTAAFSAGNAVPAEHWREIQEVLGVSELGTAYGQTEAPGITFIVRPDDPFDALVETVGRAKPAGVAGIAEVDGRQHESRIVGIDTGAPVPDGQDGEIQIKGPTVVREYWDSPDDNKKAFTEDGFLRTGDVGHLREDGFLVLTGRTKEMFKSGGENVTPKEVEARLYEHPAVKQAIVVGIPDPKWGESGCAFIVLKPGREAAAEELIAHCRSGLARYKVPQRVFLIEEAELPLTGLGKLHRQQLVERAVALTVQQA